MMDPLTHAPTTFREIVEADLRRAARLIVKVQNEIDWQWRIATPDGDYHIAMTMPAGAEGQQNAIEQVAVFMVWKQAIAFVLATETHDDTVYALGVSQREAYHCRSAIARSPRPWTSANFGSVEWLPRSAMDPQLLQLLPRAPRPLKPFQVKEMADWFGANGRFPAVHVPTGEVRGV